MKGRSKMLKILISILVIGAIGCLITWGAISYIGRTETLQVKSIENTGGEVYIIRLTKPQNKSWKAGSYSKITLPEVEKKDKRTRWLTIASLDNEDELVLLTKNSGTAFKKNLTSLSQGSEVKISWIGSKLEIKDENSPLVFFGSDVGIAAIRPIVKEWAGKREIILTHFDKNVLAFDKELSDLSSKNKNLNYSRSSSIEQSKEKLEEVINRYGNKAIYILTGQPDDVKSMSKYLKEKGIDNKQIKTDKFTGLK